ncbi:MAG: exodeoxyribonuclease VII small subunit [Flavobacteriales bacterium]|jgi:exodeoxyribonuclease VII small subunit
MKEMRYTEAMEELEEIILQMEKSEISIDDLSIKVKRASELILFCREKLRTTELDVEGILKGLEESSSSQESPSNE